MWVHVHIHAPCVCVESWGWQRSILSHSTTLLISAESLSNLQSASMAALEASLLWAYQLCCSRGWNLSQAPCMWLPEPGSELWLSHLCSNPLALAHLSSFFSLQNNMAPSYLLTIWRTDWVLLWFVTFWKSNYLFLASFSLFYIPLGKWNCPSGFLHTDFFSSNIMG